MSFFKTYFLHFICNIFAFCVQHYNYHTLEKSVYQWKVETGNSKADANRILQAKKQVKKRVFTRKSSEEYIVVEEELSVDTYVKRQVYRYACMIVLPIGYLICLWIFWRLKKRRSKLVEN